MDDCPELRRSIRSTAMRWAWTAIAALLAAGAAAGPAVAMPDRRNERPKVVSVDLTQAGARATVVVVGRDRDDLVRGADVSWGEGQAEQGLSACSITGHGKVERGRRSSRQRFELSYDYPAVGDYTITVRVYSGGCGKRPLRRSAPRTLAVHVG
jgi:hypothetical protein